VEKLYQNATQVPFHPDPSQRVQGLQRQCSLGVSYSLGGRIASVLSPFMSN